MLTMHLYVSLIFGIYILLTFFLILGIDQAIKKSKSIGSLELISFSIIIALKNEEKTILSLIASLKALNYPGEKFEVILVDDHSTDQSPILISDAIEGLNNFKLISADWRYEGKKRALERGIEESVNWTIVTTDADCIVGANWLMRINETFNNTEAKLVFGGVRIIENGSFFSTLQAVEFSSLIGSGFATLSFGIPSMCNGANLAFKKTEYYQVKGYEGNFEIASGDDEFLMRKINDHYPRQIAYMSAQDSIVATQPQPSLRAFINQRLRWAAKLPYNSSWTTKILGWYIILFQATYLLVIAQIAANSISYELFLSLIGLKLLVEFIFLRKAMSFLKSPWSYSSFVALQILYPLYVVYVGIASNFISYTWKGKKYKV